VIGLTDSSGALVNNYSYDPFGRLLSSTQAVTNVFQYGSGYLTTANVYQFGERYYDPKYGRWTQQDPVIRPGDLRDGTRYLYVRGNPVNYTDPTGKFCVLGFIGDTCKVYGPTSPEVSSEVTHIAVDCGTGAHEFIEQTGGETGVRPVDWAKAIVGCASGLVGG
jgi:RHS repeat-associated protein